MMIRELHLPYHGAASRADRLEEALRVRNPRNGKRRPARHLAQQPPSTPRRASTRKVRGVRAIQADERIGCRRRVDRLAQPPAGQRARVRQILGGDENEIRVTMQIEVLKPVVQNVDGAAEMALGEASGEIPAARGKDSDTIETPRQHQRLVARAIQIRANAAGVADDDHSVCGVAPRVASAQDCGPFAARPQPFGDQGGHWRFGTAADREIADADHRT